MGNGAYVIVVINFPTQKRIYIWLNYLDSKGISARKAPPAALAIKIKVFNSKIGYLNASEVVPSFVRAFYFIDTNNDMVLMTNGFFWFKRLTKCIAAIVPTWNYLIYGFIEKLVEREKNE